MRVPARDFATIATKASPAELLPKPSCVPVRQHRDNAEAYNGDHIDQIYLGPDLEPGLRSHRRFGLDRLLLQSHCHTKSARLRPLEKRPR